MAIALYGCLSDIICSSPNDFALQNMSFLPSINSPNAGHFQGYTREMRPPLPPQLMEIPNFPISRTLPSLPTGGIELPLPPSHGYGDIAYGTSNIARMNQHFTDGQIVRSAQDSNPIQSWYQTNDGPWTHIPKVMPPNNASLEGGFDSKQTANRNHITSAGQYRPYHASDSGSFHHGVPPPSDSGYASGTRRSVANTSVISGDIPDRDQDCHSLTGQVESFQPFIGAHDGIQQRDARSFDVWTSSSPTSMPESRGMRCPTCNKPVKTQSEMKYESCHQPWAS